MVVYTMSKPEGRKKKSQLMDETNQQHETHESFTRSDYGNLLRLSSCWKRWKRMAVFEGWRAARGGDLLLLLLLTRTAAD
jgi:hypothetical protein